MISINSIMSANSHFTHITKKVREQRTAPIDKLVYLAVVMGPIMTIPQVYSIWVQKNKGVSVVSWIAYLLISCIWLIYGLKHRDKPIIIVQVIWIALDGIIVAGLLNL